MDSGATNHICFYLSHFSSLILVFDVIVRLPNGIVLAVSHKGSIVLNAHLVFHDVYYIPQFSFNLISATQLTSQSHCYLLVSSSSCVIHDQFSLEKIGYARVYKGLYFLETDSLCNSYFSS